ncbi:MAG: hypothetical protein GY870_17400, partial [archaeon]|nr:hypothetical protein [archaeon]
MVDEKVKVYLTTNVFREVADNLKVSQSKREEIINLWNKLGEISDLKVSNNRFPSSETIKKKIFEWGAQVIGCHLSHPITEDMLTDPNSNVISVTTSTAGYNHINLVPGVLITHTPGVLHRTVADFTISAILANLRNIVGLHNFVWNEQWKPGQKWDLDENLSSTMDNLTLGIVGMGEIGKEITKRIAPWGVKILYFDIVKQENFEKNYDNLTFIDNLEEIFSQSDIISLHMPLNDKTKHIVSEKLLKLLKKNALLVNTARGPVLDSQVLMDLLEKKEVKINLSFDVYEDEPIKIEDLKRFKNIAEENPDLRFVFIPHNASADADTRAQMAIIVLEDIISIATSKSAEDLKKLRLIPQQHYLHGGKEKQPDFNNYRILK